MKAFTLIETLISLSILIIVTSGILLVLTTADKVYVMNSAFLDLQQQTRHGLDSMTKELRGAGTVAVATNGTAVIFSTPRVTNAQFYLNATSHQLVREYPAGTNQILANSVSSLSFCCWHEAAGVCDTNCTNSTLIEVGLTTAKTSRGRALSFSLKGQSRGRNE